MTNAHNMMRNNWGRRGFTLIEMLVVIAIIGLLSSTVIIGLGSARIKARDSRRVADVTQIQNWAEINYSSANGYPPALTGSAPQDDPNSVPYAYQVSGGGDTAQVGACLEGTDNAIPASEVAARCPGGLSCDNQHRYCLLLSGQ